MEEVEQATIAARAECEAAQASRRADLAAEQVQAEELAAQRIVFEQKMLAREKKHREAEAARRDMEARLKLRREQRGKLPLAEAPPRPKRTPVATVALPATSPSVDAAQRQAIRQELRQQQDDDATKRRELTMLVAMQDEFEQRYSDTAYARRMAHMPAGEFAPVTGGPTGYQYQSSRDRQLSRAFDNPVGHANIPTDPNTGNGALLRPGGFRHSQF